MTIELPLPPTTNNLYVNVPRRGRVPSATYTAWKKLVAPILSTIPPDTAYPVALTLTIIGGKGWRRISDIANREKAVTDALVNAGIIPDDNCQFVRRVVIEYREPTDRQRPASFIASISAMNEG